MINVAIVEDEPSVTETLISYFERMEKEYGEYQFHVESYLNALQFLEKYKSQYDIVLLDIMMPHMDGMEAAHKIREIDKTVTLIFVTNMAQFAIKGYEVHAFDFIVKPVKYYGFAMKIQTACNEIQKREAPVISINTQDGTVRLQVDDLVYIESFKHSITYHTLRAIYLSKGRETLTALEKRLNPYGFLRCKNSYLVNIHYIRRISGNIIELPDAKVEIGRSKRKEFLEEMAKYLGNEEVQK